MWSVIARNGKVLIRQKQNAVHEAKPLYSFQELYIWQGDIHASQFFVFNLWDYSVVVILQVQIPPERRGKEKIGPSSEATHGAWGLPRATLPRGSKVWAVLQHAGIPTESTIGGTVGEEVRFSEGGVVVMGGMEGAEIEISRHAVCLHLPHLNHMEADSGESFPSYLCKVETKISD